MNAWKGFRFNFSAAKQLTSTVVLIVEVDALKKPSLFAWFQRILIVPALRLSNITVGQLTGSEFEPVPFRSGDIL